jgi:hypothetical protein
VGEDRGYVALAQRPATYVDDYSARVVIVFGNVVFAFASGGRSPQW